ncbi:MAG: hypothetical protein KA275_01510 [Chitinophagaceae bacterium]|nr:hypothetical protein [Chitinophagaceae bacterium]
MNKESPKSSNYIYQFISYLFHPAFVPAVAMFFLLFVYQGADIIIPQGKNQLWFITACFSTILFPLLVVFLMWRLQFINSIKLETQQERYVPLIASMLFYFWAFWVFHKSLAAPAWIQVFLLGMFLGVVLLFLVNLFLKLSMHTAAWSGLLTFALLMQIFAKNPHTVFLILVGLILSAVISSRIKLQAHTKKEIIAGILVGFLAMLISFGISKI